MFPDLTTWFVIFVRFGAYLLMFPLTAAQTIPVMLRVGFAALGAMVVLPLVPEISADTTSLYPFIKLFMAEASTGLILGLAARFLFYAVEMVGSIKRE